MVGKSIWELGRDLPGSFSATGDSNSLPKLSSLSTGVRAELSGDVLLLDYPNKGEKLAVQFVHGILITSSVADEKLKESLHIPTTTDQFVRKMSDRADLRFFQTGVTSFEAKLPEDVDKLKGFSGTLTTHDNPPILITVANEVITKAEIRGAVAAH